MANLDKGYLWKAYENNADQFTVEDVMLALFDTLDSIYVQEVMQTLAEEFYYIPEMNDEDDEIDEAR